MRRASLLMSRPMFLVAPEDAFNLYRRAHDLKVGVLGLGETFVCIEPRTTAGPCLALWQFVRYKAQWMGTIGLDPSQAGKPKVAVPYTATLDAFDRWPWPQACDGPSDPRILPLSVFLGLVKAEDLGIRQVAFSSTVNTAAEPGSIRVNGTGDKQTTFTPQFGS